MASVEDQRVLDALHDRVAALEKYVGIAGTAPGTETPGNVDPAIAAALKGVGVIVSKDIERRLGPVTGKPVTMATLRVLQENGIPFTTELGEALENAPVPTARPEGLIATDAANEVAALKARLAELGG